MTVGQILFLMLVHGIGFLVLPAYFVVSAAVFPRVIESGRNRLQSRPFLTTLLGLAVSLPWTVAAYVLMESGGTAAWVGLTMGLTWIFVGLIGASSVACHIGSALRGESNIATTAGVGGVPLVLTWALPLVGWMCVLPISLAVGTGCLIAGLFAGDTQTDAKSLNDVAMSEFEPPMRLAVPDDVPSRSPLQS